MNTFERHWKKAFLAIMVVVAIDRLWMLGMTIGHANDDMTIFWLAATDYSNGIFREPFFYGQDYSIMLEALFAVPFLWFGVDVAVAVPIVMAFLAIIPFWSFALWYRSRGEALPALVFAAMPVLLPVEHALNQMVGSGLAVLALFPWLSMLRNAIIKAFLSGVVLAAAVVVQANALPFAVALGLCALFENRKWRWWVACISGAAVVGLAWWKAREFYANVSGGVVNSVYGSWSQFEPELIAKAFTRLDAHFSGVSPVWWPNGFIAFLLLVLLTALLFARRRQAMAIGLLGALTVIIIAFGFRKIHDGTGSFFFPLFRMFLSVPLLIAWGVAGLKWRMQPTTFHFLAAATIILGCAATRLSRSASIHEHALSDQQMIPIRVRPVAWIRATCDEVARRAIEERADLIVAPRDVEPMTAHFIAYGVPALHPDAPPTFMPNHERRYWRREEWNIVAERRILIVRATGPEVWTARGVVLPSIRFWSVNTPLMELDPSIWALSP